MPPSPPPSPDAERRYRQGLAHAAAAYLIWSANPLYFALLAGVPAMEITAHRAWWSLPVLIGLLAASGRLGAALRTILTWPMAGLLLLSSFFIGANWWLFVHGLETGRTLEMSFGYYIYPLLSVAAGYLLGERFSRLQALAVALVALAVLWLMFSTGAVPWLALLLGGSFTIYGLLRKHIAIGALEGLLAEALVLSAAFGLWLAWRHAPMHFGATLRQSLLLALAGPMTVAPLAFYAAAARRIRFSTLGLMFYIIPTSFFITAIFIFGEPFDASRAMAFVLIWAALALYSWDTFRGRTAS